MTSVMRFANRYVITVGESAEEGESFTTSANGGSREDVGDFRPAAQKNELLSKPANKKTDVGRAVINGVLQASEK